MAKLVTLNAKERKIVLQALEAQYGIDPSFLKRYVFLFQERKEKYFIVNEEVYTIDLASLNVDALGLYLCSRLKNGELRMSIEGSQLIGPHATRNVLEITDEEFFLWIRGNDLEKETALKGFLIVKHNDDFVGAGKPVLDEKSGKTIIHNYVPKTRYVRSDD